MIRTKGYEIHETPYEEPKTIVRKPRGGFCSSHKCLSEYLGKKHISHAVKPILKTKDRSVDKCHDCGHYLFWDEL